MISLSQEDLWRQRVLKALRKVDIQNILASHSVECGFRRSMKHMQV
jgi:hypothetical protein